MDEDILKTSSCSTDDSSSMDMMGMEMMMQMEKFPELLYEPPFYNNNNILSTYTEYHNDFSGNSGTETTTLPVFSSNVINPNVTHPIPPLSSASLFLNNNNNIPLQQQHCNEVVPIPSSGRLNNYNANSSEKNNKNRSNSVAAMREMIFRIAVMQPIHIDPESIKPPKRRNVKISKDPQSVAARHRRERISERIRILQRLVPGGTKMDTASMLDEAIHYVKFLKKQVQTLEQAGANSRPFNVNVNNVVGFPGGMSNNVNASVSVNYPALLIRGCQPCQMVGSPNSKQMLS